ncbi:MAG: hypothetical protein ACLPUO_01735 [Streptosporangiaceae bacterium]|jgi:hypothetical protein
MSPRTEQLIRDYLNRVSVAALGRLSSHERRALLARTREAIEREVGTSAAAPAEEVESVLAGLGEPEALVERATGRPAAAHGSGPARFIPAAFHPVRGAHPDTVRAASREARSGPPEAEADPGSVTVRSGVPARTREFTAATPVASTDAGAAGGSGPDGRQPGGGEPGAGQLDVPPRAGGLSPLRRLRNRPGAAERRYPRGTPEAQGLPSFAELAARARTPGPAAGSVRPGPTPAARTPAASAAANGGRTPADGTMAAAGGVSSGSSAPSAGKVSSASVPSGSVSSASSGPSGGRTLSGGSTGAARRDATTAARGSRRGNGRGARLMAGRGSSGEPSDGEAPLAAAASGALSVLAGVAAGAWALARQYPLEACALVLLGLGGLIFPPVWLFGVLVALLSKAWDFRDKWIGLAGPVILVIVGAWLAVTVGGKHGSIGAYAYEAWVVAGYLSRVAALLGAVYLGWRLHRGPREPAVPPWNRHHLS